MDRSRVAHTAVHRRRHRALRLRRRRCLTCHNGAREQWPLTSYEHVADWFAEIRGEMVACTMPPLDSGITMPDAERDTILQWIRCGFRP